VQTLIVNAIEQNKCYRKSNPYAMVCELYFSEKEAIVKIVLYERGRKWTLPKIQIKQRGGCGKHRECQLEPGNKISKENK
jgi:hypothetical protein